MDKLKGRAEVADQATVIWTALEADLSDRGCFNGIDDDVMEELAEAQISTITRLLAASIR